MAKEMLKNVTLVELRETEREETGIGLKAVRLDEEI